MVETAVFRVVLPTGKKTKPYSKAKITSAFESGKLPANALVGVNGSSVQLIEFCSAPAVRVQSQLVEQTSKPLKAIRLSGFCVIAIGVIIGALNFDEYGVKEGLPLALTIGFVLAGGLTLATGWFLSWWHHS